MPNTSWIRPTRRIGELSPRKMAFLWLPARRVPRLGLWGQSLQAASTGWPPSSSAGVAIQRAANPWHPAHNVVLGLFDQLR
jgi:hypothetical protein